MNKNWLLSLVLTLSLSARSIQAVTRTFINEAAAKVEIMLAFVSSKEQPSYWMEPKGQQGDTRVLQGDGISCIRSVKAIRDGKTIEQPLNFQEGCGTVTIRIKERKNSAGQAETYFEVATK